MKRQISSGDGDGDGEDSISITATKKMKQEEEPVHKASKEVEAVLSDDNLLYEVFKHVDARTLASAACVSKQWSRTAHDERLWEMICTKHSAGRHQQLQLRAVVLALGGFRRLFSLYLWPLLKPSSSSSSTSSPPPASTWPCLPPPPSPAVPARSAAGKTRWGKDEVNLSLSLLSISYYGKMNFNNRGK